MLHADRHTQKRRQTDRQTIMDQLIASERKKISDTSDNSYAFCYVI